MTRKFVLTLFSILFLSQAFAQGIDEAGLKQLNFYQDSLKHLGSTVINNDNELVRKNASYQFIKTLVSALKTPNSFHFPFDSVKTITLTRSPDDKFRIFSWHVANDDGSYRFYGAIQINTGGPLKLYGLEDYTPLLKNPEDTVGDNRTWYGAQYYTIIPVGVTRPYYVLLGWKGNNDRSTKKVIEVLSFQNNKPVFGMPIFNRNGKKRDRIVFEYARQASMLLKYVPSEHLIVFDNLAAPDKKSKDKLETYGPDLTYNGYRLKDGTWHYMDNMDMRNVPSDQDETYIDPKITERPKILHPIKKKQIQ
ncbi:hypothetical protein [Mucilaginibacter sp. UR6-11]|uniref:hypothetical protein n=1 Tax=Mucilaginibacter sp. UR6-11 TaxID=1435644 RepID=UPI001E3914E8|nr:hypothetical protein [Mucilaginibacter sp. UR6-11]MCC8425471.1 hypothetical protein [Mucilaginibacter sp. UR6-11]